MIMKKISLRIGGMSCQHCVKAVEKALLDLPGVQKVLVDLPAAQANLVIDENSFSWEKAENAIADQEYEYLGPVV